jgi:hypothetical protein
MLQLHRLYRGLDLDLCLRETTQTLWDTLLTRCARCGVRETSVPVPGTWSRPEEPRGLHETSLPGIPTSCSYNSHLLLTALPTGVKTVKRCSPSVQPFEISLSLFHLFFFLSLLLRAQLIQCLTTEWAIEVRSPAEARNFSSSFCDQTGSEAHPASCPMDTGDPFPGVKARPGRDADYSPSSNAKVVNE